MHYPRARHLRFAMKLAIFRTMADFNLDKWPHFSRSFMSQPGYLQWRQKLEKRFTHHYREVKTEDIVINP